MTAPGTLYLLPVPLGPGEPSQVLSPPVLAHTRRLTHFVVEHAKSARAFLKAVGTDQALQSLHLAELNEHTRQQALEPLLAPLLAGHDLGLLSEAGCPAIADPGAELVALAQARGIRVVPLVGPSSILLSLMGSGLCGQRFAFHGYLPAKDEDRRREIKSLELESRKRQQTQIFIETPYRNRAMLTALAETCLPGTRITVATDLTLAGESIVTRTASQWKQLPQPELDKRPTVFLLLA